MVERSESPTDLTDPEAQRDRFRTLASFYKKTEIPGVDELGNAVTIRSYRTTIDPRAEREVNDLHEFRTLARAQGLKEAFAPMVLTQRGRLEGDEIAIVQLGYEVPNTPTTTPPARGRQLPG